MDEYIGLSRAVLALCSKAVPNTDNGAAISMRALSTALAVNISAAKDPCVVLALVVRDLAEAAIRTKRISAFPPQRRRRKNVVELSAARRSKRRGRNVLDPESA